MALKSLLFLLSAILLLTTKAQALYTQTVSPPAPVLGKPTPTPSPTPYTPTPPLVKPTPTPSPPPPPYTPPPPLLKPPTPPPYTPAPPPYTPAPPLVKPPYSPSPPVVKPPSTPSPPLPPVRTRKDCIPLCGERCKLHSRKNLCLRACMTCCDRCKCVPPGTYGNRDKCGKCYTGMTTRRNKPKCP